MTKKVLLVDDDRLNVTLIRFACREARFEVVTAADGREGLEAVRRESPDLIVLDIQMPNMSGFEFINELKTLPGGALIPVIMLTANANMQDVFLSEGVKGYFVKPVDPPKLLARILALLGPVDA
ncbi:MAG: response regulator [Candidatus Omnitrophica bacterium]|nr:response regulator [Candidatus Omnitrophota bacterium]